MVTSPEYQETAQDLLNGIRSSWDMIELWRTNRAWKVLNAIRDDPQLLISYLKNPTDHQGDYTA